MSNNLSNIDFICESTLYGDISCNGIEEECTNLLNSNTNCDGHDCGN